MPAIPRKLLNLVIQHFQGNSLRAKLWFEIPNPVLNGMKPKDYHLSGKWDRLEKMIYDALEETTNESTSTTNA